MAHDAVALREVVERYLHGLERFDLDAVLACFTEDAFYSHPPYSDSDNGGLRHEVTGHADLVRLFERRGHRPGVRHDITHAAIEGGSGFVAGTFSRADAAATAAGSFVSAVTLAADGRIAAYAAYASVPAVGAQLTVPTVHTSGGVAR